MDGLFEHCDLSTGPASSQLSLFVSRYVLVFVPVLPLIPGAGGSGEGPLALLDFLAPVQVCVRNLMLPPSRLPA